MFDFFLVFLNRKIVKILKIKGKRLELGKIKYNFIISMIVILYNFVFFFVLDFFWV